MGREIKEVKQIQPQLPCPKSDDGKYLNIAPLDFSWNLIREKSVFTTGSMACDTLLANFNVSDWRYVSRNGGGGQIPSVIQNAKCAYADAHATGVGVK